MICRLGFQLSNEFMISVFRLLLQPEPEVPNLHTSFRGELPPKYEAFTWALAIHACGFILVLDVSKVSCVRALVISLC